MERLITLVFFSALLLIFTISVASAATWYVDDDGKQHSSPDFTNIQEAINSANSGDTIYVYPGSYAPVTVNKRLKIEGINYPVISAHGNNGITLREDNCEIRGFTIRDGSSGIFLDWANNSIISDNLLVDNGQGIYLSYSEGSTISSNLITGSNNGIYIYSSDYNNIQNNIISDNSVGIYLIYSFNNEIKENKIPFNGEAFFIYDSEFNIIRNNGIFLNSAYGIALVTSANDNQIYLNNIIDSYCAAADSISAWNSPEQMNYTYNGSGYSEYMGNYWSDYTGYDNNGDGIGDKRYSIEALNEDYHPLMEPWENYFGSTYNSIPPEPSFTYTPSDPTVENEIEFNADSSSDPDSGGYIQSYEWDFGDGSTGSGNLEWHTYAYPGTYTVKLTVTDNMGETNTIAKVITVQPPDTTPPDIRFSYPTPADGSFVKYDWVTIRINANEVLSEATLHWDGNQHLMDVSGNSAEYNVTGLSDNVYTYYVIAKDLSGNQAQTEERTVTVDTIPPAVQFIDPTPADGNETNKSSVFINVSIGEEPFKATLNWNGSLYTMMGSGQNRYYDVTGLTSGTYIYKVIVEDEAGNRGETEERTITVNITVAGELPVAKFSYSPDSPEEGETVTFTDESYDLDGAIMEWLWDLGDGTSSTDQNPTHAYVAGTYTVRLTVTDNDGDSNSTSKEITVKEKPADSGDQGNEGATGGGGGGGGGGALPLPTETSGPTPTPTKLRTPVSIPWIPPKKTPKPSAPSIPGTPTETDTVIKRPETPEPFEGPKGLLPGFEAIFAIGGLLAVAYLLRKER
jgi:parallel beta-helix repeat protein